MCKCQNKKCKVAALSAKTADLKAKAGEPRAYSWKPTREETTYRRHLDTLVRARHECDNRQALLAIGPNCPMCARPVAPYGAEQVAGVCMVDGRLSWRGAGWGQPGPDWVANQRECLGLAWDRLTLEE